MAIVYQNGTIVSVPLVSFPYQVERASFPSVKCFGINFKTKMKIFDAAHVQAMELSDAGFEYHGRKSDIHQMFLTPTFDINDTGSYLGNAANEAMKRFTDNLTKHYNVSSYLWVKEFTAKLTPHYHMLVTMPRRSITELNQAWSRARGDTTLVKNALRTGWDQKRKRSVMQVRNYKQAVGYAAKYITKADAGDICVMHTSCKVRDRMTWEYRAGHSTKCYGMSQNLHRAPREIDFFLQMHLKPWLAREIKEVKTDFCDLFFMHNPQHSNILYQSGTEIAKRKPVKKEFCAPKKANYSHFDQTFLPF